MLTNVVVAFLIFLTPERAPDFPANVIQQIIPMTRTGRYGNVKLQAFFIISPFFHKVSQGVF
jgi:hypothetical protein